MATRTLLDRKLTTSWRLSGSEPTVERGHIIEKLNLGEYVCSNYNEVAEMARNVGIGIRQHGIKPLDRVMILAETRAEWMIALLGCLQQRVTVATAFPNLPDDGIVYSINNTDASLIFTSYDLLPRITSILPQCPNVKTVVVMEDQIEGIGSPPALLEDIALVPFKELAKSYSQDTTIEIPNPEADDVAIIIYTSGSTGIPKGV